jgi:hypothetical protein
MQRFANRFSVDKALRFEGRILDKEPIRIRVGKPKTLLPDTAITAASLAPAARRRDHLAAFRSPVGGTGQFREDLWSIVLGEVRRCEFEEGGKLANALLLWRMGTLLMGAARHLQRHRSNARSSYLLFHLERELTDRLDRKLSPPAEGRKAAEVREGRAWLWHSVAFPNTEEGSL